MRGYLTPDGVLTKQTKTQLFFYCGLVLGSFPGKHLFKFAKKWASAWIGRMLESPSSV